MGIPEPAQLVGVVKVCPRPSCQSLDIKWRYYNNRNIAGTSQPRYKCMTCEGMFTYGGKTRLSNEEKRLAALREAEEVAARKVKAEKKTAKEAAEPKAEKNAAKEAAKSMAAKKAAKEAARELAGLRAVEEPWRISSALHRIASPIGKARKLPCMIRLRLIGGAVIDLRGAPEVEMEVGADASPAVMQEGEFPALVSGPRALLSVGVDLYNELVASSESGVMDYYASGRWESELDVSEPESIMQQGEAAVESGPTALESVGVDLDSELAASSESGMMDYFAPGGWESELEVSEPESVMITGSAPNSRSWECMFS